QPVMRIEIPALDASPTQTTNGFYRMREWQEGCFENLKDASNWIINAPPAAGKSFQICALVADRLRRDENLRVVIAVPQTIIGSGFRSNNIELPDGTRVAWALDPRHDLCRETSRKSAGHLSDFLVAPAAKTMMERVVVCTHATLVRAFAKNKSAFD